MAYKLIVLALAVALVSGKAVKNSDRPVAGDPCKPEECTEQGDCRHYLTCDGGVWQQRECGKNLMWNREINNGFGGSCDLLSNLSEALMSEYESNPACIDKCEWKQTDEQRCTAKYWYREKFNRQTLTDRDHELQCPTGLIWNHEALACDHCKNVKDAQGNSCCGGNGGGDNSGESQEDSNESDSNEGSGESKEATA